MATDESFQHSMERIEYKGKKIQTYCFGTGDKVIFSFPSFPHSGLYYVLFTRYYDHSKFKFVTFDLPGWAGWSDNIYTEEPFNFESILDIADAVRKHYKIKEFSIIGYSFGGALAVMYAIRHRNLVKKLVIVSAIVDGQLMNSESIKYRITLAYYLNLVGVIKRVVMKKYQIARAALIREGIDPILLEQYDPMVKRVDGRVILESIFTLFNLNLREELEKLKELDLMIVNSDGEERFFRKQAEFLRRFFDNEASFKIHGNHNDFIARPKEKCIQEVIDFLIKH